MGRKAGRSEPTERRLTGLSSTKRNKRASEASERVSASMLLQPLAGRNLSIVLIKKNPRPKPGKRYVRYVFSWHTSRFVHKKLTISFEFGQFFNADFTITVAQDFHSMISSELPVNVPQVLETVLKAIALFEHLITA